jgi:ribokinase
VTPRMAVVGHVEWVEFIHVDQVPARGEIAHGASAGAVAGGGGAVSAVELRRLAGACTLYTALGEDEIGGRARADLERRGVRVEAARRAAPTRRAVTFVDPGLERTITTMGERLAPSGDDPLPWEELAEADGVYFTAGDETALRVARRAGVLVATSRVLGEIEPWGVPVDALVGSADDRREVFAVEDLTAPPPLAVLTEGPAGGRYWTSAEGWRRYRATPVPGPTRDAYGAGDSFAAGLTFGLASGLSPSQAIGIAARSGAEAVARSGTHGGGG